MAELWKNKIFRRAVKITAWTIGVVLLLIVAVVVSLQLPQVQNYIAQKALAPISAKTHTRVSLGSVTISLPNSVVLKDLFLEGQRHDTLLAIGEVKVDVNLFGLLSKNVHISSIRVDSLTAHVSRSLPDSVFNFQFLLDALRSDTAAPPPPVDTATGGGWAIGVYGLMLRSVNATFDDEVSGTNLSVSLGALDLSMDTFDLLQKRFRISSVKLENTSASIRQSKESPPDTSTSPPTDIDLGTAELSNIHLSFENTASGMKLASGIGTATVTGDGIDLPRKRIALKEFTLANSSLALSVPPPPARDTATAADTAGFPWTIGIEKLSLGVDDLQYSVNGTKPVRGLDPNHVHVQGLRFEAANIFANAARASAEVRHASMSEQKSGFSLRELSFYAAFDSLHAQLSDFMLETPNTSVHQDLLLRYPSMRTLTKHPGDVKVNMSVEDTHIGIADVLLFNPALPVKRTAGSIRISAGLSGLVKDLHIDEFTATAGDSTVIDVTGTVRGLPEAKTAQYDITLQKIASGRADIHRMVIDTLVPPSLSIPQSVRMTGAFKGTMNDFSASAQIWTTIGSLAAQAALQGGAQSRTSRWTTNISVDNFDLGALTNDTAKTLGTLTLKASAEGTGKTKEDIRSRVNVTVDKAVLMGYPYRNLTVDGTAGAEMFDGTIAMNDSNLVFLYKGILNASKDHPAYKFTFDLKGADLHRLGFTDDDIRVALSLSSDLTGSTVNDINGHVDLRNVMIVKNRKRFALDSLVYASVNKEKQTHVSLESPIFGATFDGTVSLGNLADALKQHFKRYFTLHDTAAAPGAPADSQSFTFKLELRDPETITDVLLPSLSRIDAGVIEANYNSMKNDLTVNIGLNSLVYNGISIDSLLFTVSSDAKELKTDLHASSIADSQFNITNLDLTGNVQHDSIDLAIRSTDADGGVKMLLAGVLSSIRDGYQFRFHPDGVVFRNTQWKVDPENFIRLGKGQFVAHRVVLSDTGQSLAVQSTEESNRHSPLKIDISKFNLATLSQIFERESGFIGGIVDGTVELKNLDKAMAFTSDLTINGLAFARKPVGDIALRADNQTPNTYDVSMQLTGNGNHVDVKGTYKTVDSLGVLDLGIDLGALNLASIEPFTFGAMTRMGGTMNGTMHVGGTTAKPSLTGSLKFADAAFNPSALDSYLHVSGGEVGFGADGIELRSLGFVDTLGNKASVDGTLLTTDYSNFKFDLSVSSDHFLLMHKPPDPKALYYGTVFIDSDIRVKGTPTSPVLDVQAKLDKGTVVTFVLPESEEDVEDRRGVVRFVDVKNPANPIMERRPSVRVVRDTTKSRFGRMDLTSNIEVTKDSKLRIFVDPVSGDSLAVQGDATFSVGMDPSGKLSVTGRYEISEGSYQVSFNPLIKRAFTIQKGSSLTWFGTPFDANVDLTAIYTVKTSTLDLVQDQIAGMSQEERTKYRQELPIQVFLQMKGRLLQPEISFKLDMPEDQRGALGGTIYSKLGQVNEEESELNKQVFALLVLGRFVSSDPLSSADEGSGTSGLVRSSVSKLLTSQLNRLSQKYVKGVDLNVGLESGQDYSSGTAENRTQLQLALSKSLFDERVTVQVGGNVDLEGPRSQQNSLNNFAGDIKVGYKLTEDGRWQMQVFRQTAYEGVIEGDLTETGVGLVFTIDYDKLSGFTLKPVREIEKEASK